MRDRLSSNGRYLYVIYVRLMLFLCTLSITAEELRMHEIRTICLPIRFTISSLFTLFYYLSCTFRSCSFSTLFFLFSPSSSPCTAIGKYSWKQEENGAPKLLYAVKYFPGISHVDPFTAGSISLELWHFPRKISPPAVSRNLFSHSIRFHIVVLSKSRYFTNSLHEKGGLARSQ